MSRVGKINRMKYEYKNLWGEEAKEARTNETSLSTRRALESLSEEAKKGR